MRRAGPAAGSREGGPDLGGQGRSKGRCGQQEASRKGGTGQCARLLVPGRCARPWPGRQENTAWGGGGVSGWVGVKGRGAERPRRSRDTRPCADSRSRPRGNTDRVRFCVSFSCRSHERRLLILLSAGC